MLVKIGVLEEQGQISRSLFEMFQGFGRGNTYLQSVQQVERLASPRVL
jgi:hypothetical protein